MAALSICGFRILRYVSALMRNSCGAERELNTHAHTVIRLICRLMESETILFMYVQGWLGLCLDVQIKRKFWIRAECETQLYGGIQPNPSWVVWGMRFNKGLWVTRGRLGEKQCGIWQLLAGNAVTWKCLEV